MYIYIYIYIYFQYFDLRFALKGVRRTPLIDPNRP